MKPRNRLSAFRTKEQRAVDFHEQCDAIVSKMKALGVADAECNPIIWLRGAIELRRKIDAQGLKPPRSFWNDEVKLLKWTKPLIAGWSRMRHADKKRP